MKKSKLLVWVVVTINITLISQNALTKDFLVSNQASSKTTPYNQSSKGILELLRSPKAYKFLSYRNFLKEFIYTNSLDDYHRSLVRVSKRYELHIPKLKAIKTKSKPINRKKVLKTISHLLLEAQKKAKFLPNEFYVVLEKLAGISRDFSVGGYIEIKLVDEIKKLGQKLVPLNNRNENYFIYLLTHARYEVFTHTLSMNQKN